jgi:hypothetical protein
MKYLLLLICTLAMSCVCAGKEKPGIIRYQKYRGEANHTESKKLLDPWGGVRLGVNNRSVTKPMIPAAMSARTFILRMGHCSGPGS